MSTAKWDSRYSHAVPHDSKYYSMCAIGGILSCGLTHTAVTPLDVVKCNMQVDPKKYKGLLSGLQLVNAEQGTVGLRKGWVPTLFGYSMQGLFKFGLYEVFKDAFANVAGEENAYKYKGYVWLAASASAEFFADIALCPMEMIKVKMQTSPASAGFPLVLGDALTRIRSDPGSRFPFGSLVPLWSRQIPYTMAKFYFFEYVVGLFYQHVFTKPRQEYSKGTQLGVTFASGYIAGVICAIVSHPADTLVSLRGKEAHAGKSPAQIAKEVGAKTLLFKGLGTRVLMIGTLTGLQWWIYDTYKTTMGLGTSGGYTAKKPAETPKVDASATTNAKEKSAKH